MIVNKILSTNPFFEAYIQSDFLGKILFISLLGLSICSWIVLIHKVWLTAWVRKESRQFQKVFIQQKNNPLGLDCSKYPLTHPFLSLYLILKKQTVDVLNKNLHFRKKMGEEQEVSFLSPSDINFVASHLSNAIADQIKNLEKNLYILATVFTLAPFLGLLGTVWGILTTFSQLQSQSGTGSMHQLVLGGLSLALATTVLGLIDAIPALIGYNYLKNSIREFETEMEGFSNEILSSVEMQYRKVDMT